MTANQKPPVEPPVMPALPDTREARWSGATIHWPLADALKWRLQFGGTLNEALDELVALCAAGKAEAIGRAAGHHPAKPNWEPSYHRPFIDRPYSGGFGLSGLSVMRPDEWSDLCLALDGAGAPTSGLDYASCRLPAWREVEFDRDALVLIWLADAPGAAEDAQAAGGAAAIGKLLAMAGAAADQPDGQDAPQGEPPKSAPSVDIHKAIAAVYDKTETAREKPPNVNEIIGPVQALLRAAGHDASGRQIQNLAREAQHSKRRGKVGKTHRQPKSKAAV